MIIKTYFLGILTCCSIIAFWSCNDKKQAVEQTTFTKIDSLTETYLALQDSMMQAWNVMVNDDNLKITAMHNLVHQLMVSGKTNNDELFLLEQRLEQLTHLRYSLKTMGNADVVEEYDFACASLVSEMISIAQARSEFAYNDTLISLATEITNADLKVNTYRNKYDSVTALYNQFIEDNKAYLKEIDPKCSQEKKPIFHMTDGY